jgi:translation initiation factor IF-3
VISEEGKQLGVITLEEALGNAESVGLDLVEVSATGPPVCKIMDYGKYRYKQSKKLNDAKRARPLFKLRRLN